MKSTNKTKHNGAAVLSRRLRAGGVYRREDLAPASSAVDRHLKQLQDAGRLKKLSQGLYYAPRQSAYGSLPPEDSDLVAAFLRDDHFLLLSPASYNTLEMGGTQLYNRTVVYNHKRHGRFTFGNRTFDFRMKPRFPSKLSLEFLFVDLLNNLGELSEEREQLLHNARFKAQKLDRRKLTRATSSYGTVATKKMIKEWLDA
ncbi:MAG: hypothetical protein KGS72_29090 [Cyanobacteria bacterium REEB67]|nr:hypothetical protein [Cyanobacteria bacterium REEB67]